MATKSGTTTKLYIDGADRTGTVTNKTLANNTNPLLIGKTGTTSFFNGRLDEVALYNTALSATDVTNHYLLGATSCPATATPYASAVTSTSGLLSYWRLGDASGTTACDSKGKNPGTYSGTFTLSQTGAITGDVDKAVLLGGTSASVSIPATASLNTADTFSIEAWTKRSAVGTAQVIASKQGTAWTLMYSTANNLVLQQNGVNIVASTTTVADTTTWHHVVATKSGATTKLYIDGVDRTGTVTNKTLANTTSPLVLGQNGASASYFKGTLDDIALYNVALPAATVSNHYALTRPPANTALPAISGTAMHGQTLSATNGSWSGSPASYAYQWRSCSPSGTNCADVINATQQTYALGQGDVGTTLKVVVTATNSAGSTSATSAQSSVIAAAPPANTALPTTSGTTTEGQSLTASVGSWTGTAPINFAYRWQRCDSSGASCFNITGATTAVYTLTQGDVGNTIRVAVTASNGGGSSTVSSQQTAVIQPGLPTNSAAPTIAGSPVHGQTLTASPGTWTGGPSFGYQWRRCDSSGTNCADVVNATQQTFVLGQADVGSTMKVVVTASNGAGSTAATSQASSVVQALAPSNASLPTIAGAPTNQATLTAGPGTWTGSDGSYTYQWLRCASAGSPCDPIAGADLFSYTVSDQDVGATLRVSVTKTNGAGASSAISEATAMVLDVPPRSTTAPTVSGGSSPPKQGETLTATQGTFAGTVTSRALQWQTCDGGGAGCADITGATASTYTISVGDLGKTVRVTDAASNSAGTTVVPSSVRGPVVSGAPHNTSPPSVTGSPAEGNQLTSNDGTWTGSGATTTYQWQRCDPGGAACSDISPGGSTDSYTVANADHGHTLRLAVTKTNAFGSDTGVSAPTDTAIGVAPAIDSDPQVTGGSTPPVEGESLTASPAAFSGAVNARSTQWQRCAPGGGACEDIAGATGSAYVVAAADVGSDLRIVETAANAAGSTVARSAPHGPVDGGVPSSTAPPAVTGMPAQGDLTNGVTLTATSGTWTSSPTSYAYQWTRCDAQGTACVPIAGATGQSYVSTSGDVGSTLRVTVTAARPLGSAQATSPPTRVIALAVAPANTALPQIAGTPRDAETLTASPGNWSGSQATYGYQWQRCDASGPGCTNIAGAAHPDYEVMPEDVGATLLVVVTATNPAGTATASSARTAVVEALPAPTSSGPADIAGTPEPDEPLTVQTDNWSSTTHVKISYQWERCEEDDSDCEEIVGANSATYRSTESDMGMKLQARVKLTGSWHGPVMQMSNSTPLLSAKTTVTGANDPSVPLVIDPTLRPYFGGFDDLDLAEPGPVFFIQNLPATRKVGQITLGDLGAGSTCPSNFPPRVELIIMETTNGEISGGGVQVARSGTDQPIEGAPHRVTFSFAPVTLVAGRSYGIYLHDWGAGCRYLRTRTWTHNRVKVNAGSATCADPPADLSYAPGQERLLWRLWHVHGENTPNGPCQRPGMGWQTAVASMPTGWIVSAGLYDTHAVATNNAPEDPNERFVQCGDTSIEQRGGRSRWWGRSNLDNIVGKDYACYWRQWADYGKTVPHGWYYALPWRKKYNGLPRDMYVKLATVPEPLPAKFAPVLRFDSHESWRPLNVDTFLAEGNHKVCPDIPPPGGGCVPIRSGADLHSHNGSDSHIDIDGDFLAAGDEAQYHSPVADCVFGVMRECDGGSRSAMYYHFVNVPPKPGYPNPYTYIDYWMFYRFNYFIQASFFHEGDWEGVSIAVSPSNPQTFDYAGLSQHGTFWSYLRENLRCQDTPTSAVPSTGGCGWEGNKFGQRVAVMVASGSHANYATPCHENDFSDCRQSGSGMFDRGYDGTKLWANSVSPDPEATLLPMLTTAQGGWGDWNGIWGDDDSPKSPLNQPWGKACATVDNEAGCLDQGPRTNEVAKGVAGGRPSLDSSPGLAARSCSSWAGAGVTAVACDPKRLRAAIGRSGLGGRARGAILMSRGGVEAPSAPGLSQLMGGALGGSKVLRVRGAISPNSQLLVRVRDRRRHRISIAAFRLGDVVPVAQMRAAGTSRALRLRVRSPRGHGVAVTLNGVKSKHVIPVKPRR